MNFFYLSNNLIFGDYIDKFIQKMFANILEMRHFHENHRSVFDQNIFTPVKSLIIILPKNTKYNQYITNKKTTFAKKTKHFFQAKYYLTL
jgi:hypothetical protein